MTFINVDVVGSFLEVFYKMKTCVAVYCIKVWFPLVYGAPDRIAGSAVNGCRHV